MAMPSSHDLSFQHWSTIQHSLSLTESNFDSDDMNWLQDTEVLLDTFPIVDHESVLENAFIYPEPTLHDASLLGSKSNSSRSPEISTSKVLGKKWEPPKVSRGRPRIKDAEGSITLEVISHDALAPMQKLKNSQ
jgi:hypothetical protein